MHWHHRCSSTPPPTDSFSDALLRPSAPCFRMSTRTSPSPLCATAASLHLCHISATRSTPPPQRTFTRTGSAPEPVHTLSHSLPPGVERGTLARGRRRAMEATDVGLRLEMALELVQDLGKGLLASGGSGAA